VTRRAGAANVEPTSKASVLARQRLPPGSPVKDAVAAVEHELRAEMASSLGRVAEKLEGFLARLAALAAEHARAPHPLLMAEHAAVRREAELHLWYLVVQREAMGLRHHARLYATYPIPPRLGR
jgi:hypothetical protein